MPRLPAALLALALLAIPTSRADTSHAPLAVGAAVVSDSFALVTWTTGQAPADYYKVYGIRNGAATFLTQTNTPLPGETGDVVVPGGYSTYAVSGVSGGIESPMRYGIAVRIPDIPYCVRVSYPPLDIGYRPSCIEEILKIVIRT